MATKKPAPRGRRTPATATRAGSAGTRGARRPATSARQSRKGAARTATASGSRSAATAGGPRRSTQRKTSKQVGKARSTGRAASAKTAKKAVKKTASRLPVKAAKAKAAKARTAKAKVATVRVTPKAKANVKVKAKVAARPKTTPPSSRKPSPGRTASARPSGVTPAMPRPAASPARPAKAAALSAAPTGVPRPPKTSGSGGNIRRKPLPDLNRERRRVPDDDLDPQSTPSSLGLDRTASAVRSGRQELRERYDKYTETGPQLTGGDIDADWESAYSVGDEAPGGDNPTPDQNVVDDIGAAVGVAYEDNEELEGAERIEERDRHRWEYDPASSEDFDER